MLETRTCSAFCVLNSTWELQYQSSLTDISVCTLLCVVVCVVVCVCVRTCVCVRIFLNIITIITVNIILMIVIIAMIMMMIIIGIVLMFKTTLFCFRAHFFSTPLCCPRLSDTLDGGERALNAWTWWGFFRSYEINHVAKMYFTLCFWDLCCIIPSS